VKKRNSIRFGGTNCICVNAVRTKELNIKVIIKDGSRSGLSLIIDRPVEKGESLWLELKIPPKKESIIAITKVQWVKPKDKNFYIAGVGFTSIKKADLAELLDYCYEEWKNNFDVTLGIKRRKA